MTSVVHVNDIAQEYRRTGDLYREKAEEEFRRGDLLQASEKAWGAVSQHLKAAAEERGWGHRSHPDLKQVSSKLAKETGNDEIRDLFPTAESLHSNFYEAAWSEVDVRSFMNTLWRYVDILKEVGPPDEGPRKPYVKDRPFFRTGSGSS